MSKSVSSWYALLVLITVLPITRVQALEIHAQGLLKDAAILMIDGRRHLLRVGKQSPEGVILVSASQKMAVIEVEGKRQQLTLSRHITGQFKEREKVEVSIPRNQRNQYITSAAINGKRTQVLVDTGATSVALSARQAKSLGIDYRKGTPMMVQTASGISNAYAVILKSVDVGGIVVRTVEASVIEGDFPATVLLGMTYLEHVGMSEQNGMLSLQAKH
jgi:aspartyl protease family protein